jgi:hypothetical protein
MSDYYTHPDYDKWKLDNGESDDMMVTCDECGDPYDSDELNDDHICLRCEDKHLTNDDE